jgi:hypothetical protein
LKAPTAEVTGSSSASNNNVFAQSDGTIVSGVTWPNWAWSRFLAFVNGTSFVLLFFG